jgi:hypothetical protein
MTPHQLLTSSVGTDAEWQQLMRSEPDKGARFQHLEKRWTGFGTFEW